MESSLGLAGSLSLAGDRAITWTLVAVGVITVMARLVTRIIDRTPGSSAELAGLRWDDFWMVVACANSIVTAIVQHLQAPHMYHLQKAFAGLVSSSPISSALHHQKQR